MNEIAFGAGPLTAAAFLLVGCTVPVVGGPLVFTEDGGAVSSDGGGRDAGAALIGDPCMSDADCASGFCANGVWCSSTCTTDQACGANSSGVPNVCAMASTAQIVCYPGCSPASSCLQFPGTQCKQLPSGGSVCSP
jgi:hypothetical protein